VLLQLCDLMESFEYSWVFDAFTEDNQQYSDYIARQRLDRAWGGEQQLRAAAILFDARIDVYKCVEEVRS
jgi:hypothetical protein